MNSMNLIATLYFLSVIAGSTLIAHDGPHPEEQSSRGYSNESSDNSSSSRSYDDSDKNDKTIDSIKTIEIGAGSPGGTEDKTQGENQ